MWILVALVFKYFLYVTMLRIYRLSKNFVCTGLKIRRTKGKLKMAAEGAQKLLEVCKHIVKNEGTV